jgi:hypothetical protein
MGEPLYGFQTPNGYSDLAETWVNTGGLLERMNFGLALASNRVQGTRVNLLSVTGARSGTEVDKSKLMDHWLRTMLGAEVSRETREALLKQLDEDMVVSLPATRSEIDANRQVATAGSEIEGPAVGGPQRRQQRPQLEASISDPVTKVVGLILGTPEFQRQ